MFALIPAYEPVEHLPELVAALRAEDPSLGILVVDDGSGPAFAPVFERVARLGAEVLRHDRNRGKGAALKTGFRHISELHAGEGVVTADADGQHLAADILAVAADVEAEGERSGRTLVLGCRDFAGGIPLRSRVGNDIARALFRVAAGWRLSDTQTGLRGAPAAMLPWLASVPGDRFEYEQRVLLGLRRAGFAARERRIETVYLSGNASSHFRPVADSLRVMLPVAVFAASSLLGFAVDTAALFLFTSLTGWLVPSIVAARILSGTVNFWVNRRVVFMRRGREGLVPQALEYTLLALLMLVSNVVWMSYLTDLGAPLWAAKLVTELVLFLTSYRAQGAVVFAEPVTRADGPLPDPRSFSAART